MSTKLKEQIQDTGSQKLWGERSLTLGELACFVIGAALIVTQKAGKWSTVLGLGIIFAGQAIF